MVDTIKNPLEQSDEDFTNMMPPVVPEEEVEQQGTAEADGDGSQNAGAEGDSGEEESGTEAEDGTKEGTEDQEGGDDDATKEGAEGEPANAGAAEEKPKDPKDSASGADSEAGAEGADDKSKKEVVAEPVGKTFAVPTTIRANGKDVVLKDEAEAVQLMQMGAHYTRKMQELAPHRKLLMMLQNNGLADEAKLTFLIDLDKKNPEAIKKLIQDAGVDPLEIDTNTEADYLPGSYGVTDQEDMFRSTLEALSEQDNGRETISEINTKWDDTSKQVVWSNPEIMTIIHQQRANGVYDTITTEIDRQITLGKIPAGTPFLEAYKQVGDQLSKEAGHDPSVEANGAKDGQKDGGSGRDPAITAPVQVATRAAPKAKLSNNDKASAASPTRTSPTTAKPAVNFFAQSDEEFMKQMDGRL